MRVTSRQERVLRAAAELTGETLTGFVLSAATERAETVLERAERIEVSADAFRRFASALDKAYRRPARALLGAPSPLRAYLEPRLIDYRGRV